MRAKALGTTGLIVTPIGLGLAAVGRPGYINLGRDADLGSDRSVEALARRSHELLDAAHAAGIRYVDTARSYGLAEAFLASWLDRRGLSRIDLTVGSKWGYTYTAAWRSDAVAHEVKDHSLPTLRRQLAESRDLLGDRLRLYQVHSATLESGVLRDQDVLAELTRLRGEGLSIGLTVSGPRQADVVRRALEVEVDGLNPFASIQATWNILEPSAGPALAEAHAAGWGVIVKEALANGRLTSHSMGSAARALGRLAARYSAPVDALAIAAALANPWADVVLTGAVTVDQLRGNLGALELSLTPGDGDALSALAEPPDRYWATRKALPWS